VATEDDDIELARVLSEISYPCGRDEVLRRARLGGAGDAVLSRLELLPSRVYGGADEALMFAADSERDLSGDQPT
jgi:hypothetical protein